MNEASIAFVMRSMAIKLLSTEPAVREEDNKCEDQNLCNFVQR